MISYLFLAWLIPAAIFGFYLIWQTSGQKMKYETESACHLRAVVVMALFWFVFIPRIVIKKVGV